jgi:hypothetical protein
MNARGTVEELLLQVDSLLDGVRAFELFVPEELTMRDRPVSQNIAMAVLLDRLLGKKLLPDGFAQQATGRLYKYRSEPVK